MALPDEPKGWRRLQKMAQRAPDAKSLALIIDQMNRLLDRHRSTLGKEPSASCSTSVKQRVSQNGQTPS